MRGPVGPADPGELLLSGGGTTMVATDAVLAQAALVAHLRAEAEGWQARLGRIRALDHSAAPQWMAGDLGLALFEAGRAVDAVEAASRDLAEALTGAAEGYGRAERSAEQFARLAGAGLGYLLGRAAPFLLAPVLPTVTVGAVAWLLGDLATPPARERSAGPEPGPAGIPEWLAGHPRLLTNPAVVALVRVLVSSADDAALGAAGAPYPLTVALGDDGAGLLGVTTSAAGLLAAARPLGLLRESSVAVTRAGGSWPTPPPSGLDELAARIPPASGSAPQVRIERYDRADGPAWVVYIGGTAQWDPAATDDPWDLSSNVAAIAGQNAGSARAVAQAMRAAGIGQGDPVVTVGHSQGGLIAAEIAASADFTGIAVATFGAPLAHVPAPSGLPELAVEHTDDLVPALGGTVTAAAAGRLVVSREAFAGRDVPAGAPLPAHTLAAYRETARLIDASPEPRLQDFRARIAEALGTEPGEATRWRGTRRARPLAVPGPGMQGGV